MISILSKKHDNTTKNIALMKVSSAPLLIIQKNRVKLILKSSCSHMLNKVGRKQRKGHACLPTEQLVSKG